MILQSSDIEVAGRDFPEFAAPLRLAYHSVPTDPGNTCGKARLVLEEIVRRLYLHILRKPLPSRATLLTLLEDHAFREAVPRSIYVTMQTIRRAGNEGVHGAVFQRDAVDALDGLLQVLRWYKETHTERESATKANASLGLDMPNVNAGTHSTPPRGHHQDRSPGPRQALTSAISPIRIARTMVRVLIVAPILALGFWGVAAFVCALFFQRQLIDEDKTVWMFIYISAMVGGVVGLLIAVAVDDSSGI